MNKKTLHLLASQVLLQVENQIAELGPNKFLEIQFKEFIQDVMDLLEGRTIRRVRLMGQYIVLRKAMGIWVMFSLVVVVLMGLVWVVVWLLIVLVFNAMALVVMIGWGLWIKSIGLSLLESDGLIDPPQKLDEQFLKEEVLYSCCRGLRHPGSAWSVHTSPGFAWIGTRFRSVLSRFVMAVRCAECESRVPGGILDVDLAQIDPEMIVKFGQEDAKVRLLVDVIGLEQAE